MIFANGLRDLAPRYDAILCDVWGVLHNGVRAWEPAMDALLRFRQAGGRVVMITNAPRPAGPVTQQMAELGVALDPDRCPFDSVVTSGDVTRGLIADATGPVFHVGPTRDHTLYEGLDVSLAEEGEARTIVCTGLFSDEAGVSDADEPENYHPLWKRLAARDLPFLCANPDIVVERGHRLEWCAGALARDYAALGGEVHIAGKPHPPIYAEAMRRLDGVDPARALAIGDGLPTDVRGAHDNGFDLLYISAGIHAAEYGEPDDPDRERLAEWLEEHGARPVASMPRLVW